MATLVTGGAGYIGAHVVRLLQERGDNVVIVDDLSTGYAERASSMPLLQLDLASSDARSRLAKFMHSHNVEQVIHFAARKQVGQSMAFPAWYYDQNVQGMANLLAAMEKAQIPRLVFSSSAAVYGEPTVALVDEECPLSPINPYGETKVVGEWLGRNAARAWGLDFVALRYFNVAGSGWPDLGDLAVLNLIPMIFDRIGRGELPRVFGADYPTSDGTCVRDYVHVLDLSHAHIAALDYLADRPAEHRVDSFNVGTGNGASVLEVIAAVGQAIGQDLEYSEHPRREGDPAALLADVSRIQREMHWRSTLGLADIVESAWNSWQVRG